MHRRLRTRNHRTRPARAVRRPQPGPALNAPKYIQVAAIIRQQILDGILPPGAPAPSGAALARQTGHTLRTCRHVLRTLIADGILIQGTSNNSRPRVPGPGALTLAQARRDLSTALAEHRRAAGLTQPQLANVIGVSVTRIGHAETGRLWQSRPFWEHADNILRANGELLRLHDIYRAAEVPSEPAEEDKVEAGRTPPKSPVVITVAMPDAVRCITVTWADGAVTTAYPPLPAQRQEQRDTS